MSINKAKGTTFERECAVYLSDHTKFWVERRALAGNLDKGDLIGMPNTVLECKNHKQLNFSGWMTEGEQEARNAGARWWSVIVKRRGKNVSESYVVMPLINALHHTDAYTISAIEYTLRSSRRTARSHLGGTMERILMMRNQRES